MVVCLVLSFLMVLRSFDFAVIDPGESNCFDECLELDISNDSPETYEKREPWPLSFADGPWISYDLTNEKRSLSKSQDWGKRNAASRPLRLGKRPSNNRMFLRRNFYFDMVNPMTIRGTFKTLKPYSFF